MLLADTHVVVWSLTNSALISHAATRSLAQARSGDGGIAASAISMLELATAMRKNRLRLHISFADFLAEIEARFVILPITSRACARTLSLPESFPNDPGDRIIAATALIEGIPLVTSDRAIRESGAVQTIW